MKILYKTLLKLTDTKKIVTWRDSQHSSLSPTRAPTHTHRHTHSRTQRSSQCKTKWQTRVHWQTLTCWQAEVVTLTQHLKQQELLSKRGWQWHLNPPCQANTRAGECMCVSVCVVNGRSRVPMRPLSELAGTYGGVPWATSEEDWWISQVLIDEPA